MVLDPNDKLLDRLPFGVVGAWLDQAFYASGHEQDRDFAGKQKEATKAIADAIIRLLQISELERRALLVKVKDALVKLEQALKALKDAANALFKDCGCLIKPF